MWLVITHEEDQSLVFQMPFIIIWAREEKKLEKFMSGGTRVNRERRREGARSIEAVRETFMRNSNLSPSVTPLPLK